MRLRHVEIDPPGDGAAGGFGASAALHELIGHLASDGRVAGLLYSRFPACAGHVARQGGEIIGFCGWRQDESLAFLGPVVVARGKRRFGVGHALVAEAVTRMRTEGVRVVESAYPEADEACARLLQGHRFRVIGEEQRAGVVWTRVERSLAKG